MHSETTECASLPPLNVPKSQENNMKKVAIGVCVMEKKALSPPMTAILDRLQAFGEFEVIIFGDKVISKYPVESWPLCDALIAFYSSGFPLKKAEEYAALRKPFLVNDLASQHYLHDRRKVYEILKQHDLPTPNSVVVNRNYPNEELSNFIEEEDYIEVDGTKITKPFVEKPVDGDDHSIMIYYPSYAGGGMKELFRKVGNRSSEFHADVRRVRRQGSYIYEEFMPTGGTDVKVYTVGPDYAHAEARKSPVVDGVVMRSADGKEVRYPVLLTPTEKEMAREVCLAFGQSVCGFDLLRSNGRSYVCDVNGWSFVKNSPKYYDDAACVLRKILLKGVAPHLYSPLPSNLPWNSSDSSPLYHHNSFHKFERKEELRCVIAVIRHGDRTPKQKVKLKVTQDSLLNLMLKYNGNKPRGEAKLKSAVQLQDLLDALRMLVPRSRPARDSDSEAEDNENTEKLRHVKAVLEEGGHFSGIYRKAQIKPQKWEKVNENGEEKPTEALMILKFGGVLTHAGRKQAEDLGRMFRNNMYPDESGEGTGLIRLHSTYRHNLKIYSSDEGRVQMSAAAFTKGLLDLEGQLTPILISLVSKDSPMLDGLDTANIDMDDAKKTLYDFMTNPQSMFNSLDNTKNNNNGNKNNNQPWTKDGVGIPDKPLQLLVKLVSLIKRITAQLKEKCREEEVIKEDDPSNLNMETMTSYDTARAIGKDKLDRDRISSGFPCGSEGFVLMFARWKKLEYDIYNERKDRYNISKIPDIYDSAKYDLIHNAHLNLNGLDELYITAKALADGVIPNEYGLNPKQKLKIGSKIARRLLGKILIDLRNTHDENISIAQSLNSHTNSKKETKSDVKKRIQEKLNSDNPFYDKIIEEQNKTNLNLRRNSRSSNSESDREIEEEDKEMPYRLDPKYANVRTPERHVRTRLYFTSESHIHSLLNVLRYCHFGDENAGKQSLLTNASLNKLLSTPEFDYLTHFVIRMYENVNTDLSDPHRFRIELLFSPGIAHNPLECIPRNRDHTLPPVPSEVLDQNGKALTLNKLEEMICPFAMPAEDFPPPTPPQGFGGFFKGPGFMFERLVSFWPFNKSSNSNLNSNNGGNTNDNGSNS